MEEAKNTNKTSLVKKIFMIFGIICAIIIVLIALLIAFLLIFKPYGIDIKKLTTAAISTPTTSSYDHPYLSTQQEVMLEAIGINPVDIPTEINAEQIECANQAVGAARAQEIKDGSTPTITEAIKLKQCID